MADRLYADKSTMDIYNNSKIMGYSTENKIGRKEQFFVALGLGYMSGQRKSLKTKELMFLEKDMSEKEVALLWAIAIKEKGSIQNVENKDEIYNIAQEYANSGILRLNSIEKTSSYENYLTKFEKKVLKELNNIDEDEED